MPRPTTSSRAIDDVLDDLESRPADGPADLRRRRLRQDRGGAARRLRRRHVGHAGRRRRADDAARAPALQELRRALPRPAGPGRASSRASSRPRRRPRPAPASPTARSRSSSAPTRCWPRRSTFADLGLLVIDEEQHFGVAHKERLKAAALRRPRPDPDRDADPAHPAAGAVRRARAESLIATPPVDRLAIRTYVSEFDPVTIREALLREHYRGGQSFYVVPRIADLAEVEAFLREQVPEVQLRRRPRPDGGDASSTTG